mmetsp:Transcript_15342/g.23627  ORF Transcript_15342/g.23627 Transcript_15342/m.23627 type:complete len:107 (+) Transcript_15342:377-697(+)
MCWRNSSTSEFVSTRTISSNASSWQTADTCESTQPFYHFFWPLPDQQSRVKLKLNVSSSPLSTIFSLRSDEEQDEEQIEEEVDSEVEKMEEIQPPSAKPTNALQKV